MDPFWLVVGLVLLAIGAYLTLKARLKKQSGRDGTNNLDSDENYIGEDDDDVITTTTTIRRPDGTEETITTRRRHRS